MKQKLVAFLNEDKAVEAYLKKAKSEMVSVLHNAKNGKKQVLLVNYASGNSQTIKNRLVEPFEFKDDFNLVWAFDTDVMKNRQFKISRMEDVLETPLHWQCEYLHQSKPVDIFRNTGELDKQVELELNVRARNLLLEEYPLTERYITETTKNHFLFKAPVAKYEGPARFILGMTEDIRLVGDDFLRKFVREKLEKCQRFL